MKKYLIRLASVLGGILLLGVIGIFALPPLLKPYLEQEIGRALKRDVRLGHLAVNPFLFKLTLDDLSIRDRYGEFVAIKTLVLDAELMSLVRGGVVLRELTLQAPKINIVRLDDKTFNYSDLLPSKSSATSSSEALRFALNNIRITQGQLVLDDQVKGVKQTLDQFNLALPFLSNLPQRIDDYIAPALSGRINGKIFALKGQSKPFKNSLDTSLRFSLVGLDLTKFAEYTPMPDAVDLRSGLLDAEVDLVFRQEKTQASLLLNGQLALNDTRVQLEQQDALRFNKLSIGLNGLKPLVGDWHFGKIALDGLDLQLVRNAQARLNWQVLLPAPATPASPTSAVPRITVDEFALNGGKIAWRDQAVSPAIEQQITDFSLVGKDWSTTAKKTFPLRLNAKTADGAQLQLDLQASAQPLQLSGKAQLDALQLGAFSSYYAPYFNGRLDALLSSKFDLGWQSQIGQFQIKAADLSLAQLAVKLPQQKQNAISIDTLEVNGLELDSATQLIDIARLQSQNAKFDVQLLPGQRINLMSLLVAAQQAAGKRPASKPLAVSATEAPWRLRLKEAQLDQYAVRLEDRTLEKPTPLELRQITVNLQNLDTQTGSSAQLDVSALSGRKSSLKLSGPFVLQPFSGQWQLDFRGLDAAYGQPYFNRLLNISLASGFVDLKGRLTLATHPQFSGSYQGYFGVRQFYALDKLTGDDFLKWKTLAINGLKANFVPPKVDIAEVKLDNFFSRLILSPNGRMNLQDIMVGEGGEASVTRESTATQGVKPATASAVSPAPVPIRIGKIVLSGGNIRYSDLLIKPNYTANLTGMGGQIAGISSQNDTRASLDLKGSVDNIAPVQIQGALNPLSSPPFFDLKGGVKGYELTSASTYAEKYAGYGISKGKMSMDMAYFIENGQLKASNQLFLDQLTLSDEKTDSPEATKLPVKFVLSLLTDRRGQIKLNLPIEGSLNDPQFKVGAVIWQVIGNLLEKIVTSPFDALASAFSDGPSLSYIAFEPGSARLGDEAKKSITQLAAVLDDRPGLRLEVAGWASLSDDGDGIRQRLLRQKMRAIKAEKISESSESVQSDDEIKISEEEKPALIAAVYKQSKFDKPTNILGINKKLPVDEMQALILKNTLVTDQDLLALANFRARQVDAALKAAGLAAERIFIVQPQINPEPPDSDKGTVSRVQFKLQ
ncbi:DUF748 domain-containing protein [Chitinibacter sp. S2-10]|uniref:DUF748 domain-containing protein n=1 Tax=Chitinibacter sp. S2-10 TaxID=3373597 RepID=UPI00397760B6